MKTITVKTNIKAPIDKVWKYFTEPMYIKKWNHASEDWHTPEATNDLNIGGNFSYIMAAKDGSFSFDFNGTYIDIQAHKYISYTIADGRKVEVMFTANGNETEVTEIFEAENQHSLEMQEQGWQAILDNFRKFTESE